MVDLSCEIFLHSTNNGGLSGTNNFALKGEPISAVINAMTLILLEISVVLMP